MHLDEDKATERLESPSNLANRFGKKLPPVEQPKPLTEEEVEEEKRAAQLQYAYEQPEVIHKTKSKIGRKNGVQNLPPFMRTTAAILSHVDTQANVAKEFGISQPEVGNYKNGKVEANQAAVQKSLDGIRDLALEKTMMSLGLLTVDKVKNAKARDIASIAKDMATVVEKVSPKQLEQGKEVTLVVYAPQVKTERGYNTVMITAED